MTLNIASYSDDWRARLLSAFAHTPFHLWCGAVAIRCESVEGFWQGLKWPEGSAARGRAFGLWGIEAKHAGEGAPDGDIVFCGTRVARGGADHHALAERAMRAKLAENPEVLRALAATAGLRLTHDLIDEAGVMVPDSLTLPKMVFIAIWERLRDELPA